MAVTKITAPEGDLLNLLYEISPLEWRKYQQRHPEIWADNHFERVNRSEYPPYISFRFEDENKAVIERLRQAVENYPGKIFWVLNEHKRDGLPGTNWTIGPSRLWDVKEQALKLGLTPDQYLAQYEPEFGPVAYDDLEGLTKHIRQAFPEVPSSTP
ncbi:hypothetical protein RRX38_14235 [Pseudomonas sp. DTU_2021_1001937_2_SI_NGA_ILE_001]|uniref:hypothetical protein n=1 Tax=Pseudomonas sp. DTU_2021_1001937_2_SI_NGA_ILE_001 TaxID=3077589 RepID=UPI0028FC0C2A|nr:hypothetical protein [Pseudomonas sp. DTU_2021_1001937_2_SI_NGA_ILE_001]WNW12253.1 hypothetical protein RRX38_14235 [Pseudomonas sp. DTU_2021_1001937_2_SI_NGA_ILE_001]